MLKYHFFAVLGILFRYFFVPLPMVLKAENGLERKKMPLNAIFRFGKAGGETPTESSSPGDAGAIQSLSLYISRYKHYNIRNGRKSDNGS